MAIRCDEFAIISFLDFFFLHAFTSGTANTARTDNYYSHAIRETHNNVYPSFQRTLLRAQIFAFFVYKSMHMHHKIQPMMFIVYYFH